MLPELCLVFTPLGLEAEQGAEAMGLKVKHHAAFGCPGTVCQSLLSSSCCPQSATARTSCAMHLNHTKQDYCSRAGRLDVVNADAINDTVSVECLLDF